jgi:hypothetical protein
VTWGACRTGRASRIDDSVGVGGGRTCRRAGLVFVQHDHERADERPSVRTLIGNVEDR